VQRGGGGAGGAEGLKKKKKIMQWDMEKTKFFSGFMEGKW
jgi:hypothetical protein